jgi:hypothetical protein
MDFLEFASVSFRSSTNIGCLCKDLNKIIGQCLWYDTFQAQNIKWLWLVVNIVAAMNKNNILCGCFRLCPSFVAEILNSVKDINFYVVCSEIVDKKCTISHTGNYFQLSSDKETIVLSFEARTVHGQIPSEIVFAYVALSTICLSSPA